MHPRQRQRDVTRRASGVRNKGRATPKSAVTKRDTDSLDAVLRDTAQLDHVVEARDAVSLLQRLVWLERGPKWRNFKSAREEVLARVWPVIVAASHTRMPAA